MKKKKEKVIEVAQSLVGTPYKYGAKMEETPNFFDCSGFIKYIFQIVDINVPRSTIEQAEFTGEKVKDLSGIEPCDLVFFRGSRGHYNKRLPGGVGHVAIYVGDNKAIHAESERVQHTPKIKEEGEVKIDNFENLIERLKPIVIIKRVISIDESKN